MARKNVLVLGAGLVARPLVRYLLDRGFGVTVASRTAAKAEALIAGHPNGRFAAWTVDKIDELGALVAQHDLAVSLLPAPNHPVVAKACLAAGKHMVTTSYVGPAMRELDGPARDKGLIFLNELGVDPGIDHMSIMKILDRVHGEGGKMTKLISVCGGLPAPEANTNPLGYKFSWSPAGVLSAMTNPVVFRWEGQHVSLPVGGLFDQVRRAMVPGLGEFEFYPNRDSLGYVDQYGLTGIDTMFRGTFRYVGWAHLWKALWKVGLLDRSPRADLAGRPWAAVMAELAGTTETGPGLRPAVAKKAGVDAADPAMDQAEWLGLFGGAPLSGDGTLLDCIAALMLSKMAFGDQERDMLLMQHQFTAKFPDGTSQGITSTMIDYGIPGGDSSMARTVSLPAAIGVRLILEGKIAARGVHIPVIREIYDPVLDELETLDIRLVEEAGARG